MEKADLARKGLFTSPVSGPHSGGYKLGEFCLNLSVMFSFIYYFIILNTELQRWLMIGPISMFP